MLQSLQRPEERTGVSICRAAWPAPFRQGLEFNAPVHGTWNIVHTGMLLPEAHQIYICAVNCMRGVVLTAAEMGARERFSCVVLEERDLQDGTLEDRTVEGVLDIVRRLPKKPKAVLVFTVCVHHFLGCDLDYIYRRLREAEPEVAFLRCYMDPILQKDGPTPDQKLRAALYDPLQPGPRDAGGVSILGSDFAIDPTSELARLVRAAGRELRQLPECRSWEDYLHLGTSGLFLAVYPNARAGTQMQAARLGAEQLYLPASFSYDEIQKELETLSRALGVAAPDCAPAIARCEQALERAHAEIGQTPIAIDYTVHPRPLGLARLLLRHGFAVERVYLDAVSPEEEADFRALQAEAPELELCPTVQPGMRVRPRTEPKTLAVGQKAAWFQGTAHFVNLVSGAGLWGYDGICRMAELLREAAREEKDTRDLVPRKGWGCESCL